MIEGRGAGFGGSRTQATVCLWPPTADGDIYSFVDVRTKRCKRLLSFNTTWVCCYGLLAEEKFGRSNSFTLTVQLVPR